MENFKSHFVFNKSQRNGILFLIALIITLLGIQFFVDFNPDTIINTNSPELLKIQKELDSLRKIELEKRKPKIYPFNPNFITDYKGYTLGMSTKEIDRLLTFREKDKWINSKEEFQKVTHVSDSLLAAISPYFKFPDWITNPKPKKQLVKIDKEKRFKDKIDLNRATEFELQEINGIGPTFSKRIVAYREKLGGFTDDIQLYQVYGLKEEVIINIQKLFTVKTPKEIQRMNINKISASDISTIPGVSFELAKRIWEFRILNEKITHFSELEKIAGMSTTKLNVIQLYLTLD